MHARAVRHGSLPAVERQVEIPLPAVLNTERVRRSGAVALLDVQGHRLRLRLLRTSLAEDPSALTGPEEAALARGVAPEALAAALPGWIALAGLWGGAAPPATITAAVEAAARAAADPMAARADPRSGELAAGLVAATIGVPSSTAPAPLLEALAALDGF